MLRVYSKEKCFKIAKKIWGEWSIDDLLEYLPDEVFDCKYGMEDIELQLNSFCYKVDNIWEIPIYFCEVIVNEN